MLGKAGSGGMGKGSGFVDTMGRRGLHSLGTDALLEDSRDESGGRCAGDLDHLYERRSR